MADGDYVPAYRSHLLLDIANEDLLRVADGYRMLHSDAESAYHLRQIVLTMVTLLEHALHDADLKVC